jgi:hypothetical protein
VACLDYAQATWCRRHPARALLCLDRAFGAELTGGEPEITTWPLPYAATAWIIRETPAGVFLGNPRIHFQHYAGRMNEPRREQRRWRAWACWALARAVRPDLPGDPRHAVREPAPEDIARELELRGLAGEVALWQEALVGAQAAAAGAGRERASH